MSVRSRVVGRIGSCVRGLAAGLLLVLAAGPAGASVITASPVNFSASEQSLFRGTVATFTDDNPAAMPTDFVAVIDWGDGSPTSFGTITENAGTFSVDGQHTYDDEGTFAATVTITEQEPGTGFASVTDTATVAEADVLSGTPRTFAAPPGASFTATVADFSDTLTSAVASDFTATIDWGDATTSAGTVTGSSGSFTVSGQHTYADEGSFTFTVTVTEIGAGGATASSSATATVTETDALAGSPVTFIPLAGSPFSGAVATFTDSNTANTAGDFTATID